MPQANWRVSRTKKGESGLLQVATSREICVMKDRLREFILTHAVYCQLLELQVKEQYFFVVFLLFLLEGPFLICMTNDIPEPTKPVLY
jgi:hypothetical protein